MTALTLISQNKCFDGMQYVYSHLSQETKTPMRFGIFLPPQVASQRVPLLYWLSGLTCTEENFIVKAGAQRVAAELGIAIVTPDTSPRNTGIADESASYDFGTGAGFYLDATELPWARYFRMYSYIAKELPTLMAEHFPIDENRVGLFGHSMGGHGALTIGIKNPHYYKSVSALAPICSLTRSTWGEKALTRYLGADRDTWRDYDASLLIETKGWKGPAWLIDQGSQDAHLKEQLKPELLKAACEKAQVPLNLRIQEGYDHGYFFVTSFIEDHLRFHANNLK